MAKENPAAQIQTAVTAYLESKQLLLFVFARRSVWQYSMAEGNPAAQRQTAVAAYFSSGYCCLPLHGGRNVMIQQFGLAHTNIGIWLTSMSG